MQLLETHNGGKMKQIIISYNLADGVNDQEFQNWVKTFDQPNMRGLTRVKSFRTFNNVGLLMGEGSPRYSYIEIFDIDDFDGFLTQDMASELVQKVMGQFMPQVKDVEFAIANEV